MTLKGLPEFFKPFVVIHTQQDKYKTLSEFQAALTNYVYTGTIRSTQEQSFAMASKTQKHYHSTKKVKFCSINKLRSPRECSNTVRKGQKQFNVYHVTKQVKNQRIAVQNQS